MDQLVIKTSLRHLLNWLGAAKSMEQSRIRNKDTTAQKSGARETFSAGHGDGARKRFMERLHKGTRKNLGINMLVSHTTTDVFQQ